MIIVLRFDLRWVGRRASDKYIEPTKENVISDEGTFARLEGLAAEEADKFFKYNPNSLGVLSIDTVDEA